MARREKALFCVSRSPREVTTRERSNLFLPMNCRPISASQEKIGHHHWRIPQLSSLEKVWKTSYRSPGKKFPNTKNHMNRIESLDPLLSMCHPTIVSCQNIFSRSAFLRKSNIALTFVRKTCSNSSAKSLLATSSPHYPGLICRNYRNKSRSLLINR